MILRINVWEVIKNDNISFHTIKILCSFMMKKMSTGNIKLRIFSNEKISILMYRFVFLQIVLIKYVITSELYSMRKKKGYNVYLEFLNRKLKRGVCLCFVSIILFEFVSHLLV